MPLAAKAGPVVVEASFGDGKERRTPFDRAAGGDSLRMVLRSEKTTPKTSLSRSDGESECAGRRQWWAKIGAQSRSKRWKESTAMGVAMRIGSDVQ